MNILQFCLLYLAGRIDQNQQRLIDYLLEEIKVLREQLGRKPRFTDRQRVRLAAKAKDAGVDALRKIVPVVTPETLLRWHRRLIARKYDGTSKRSAGRPRIAETIRGLILRFARENPTWGYTRIQGALSNLGHRVARGTVANVLEQDGIDPAPDRGPRSTWNSSFAHTGSYWLRVTSSPWRSGRQLDLSATTFSSSSGSPLVTCTLPKLFLNRTRAGCSRSHAI